MWVGTGQALKVLGISLEEVGKLASSICFPRRGVVPYLGGNPGRGPGKPRAIYGFKMRGKL